jgi:hypothetical protein
LNIRRYHRFLAAALAVLPFILDSFFLDSYLPALKAWPLLRNRCSLILF